MPGSRMSMPNTAEPSDFGGTSNRAGAVPMMR